MHDEAEPKSAAEIGAKGGKARAEKLSKKQRSEIARTAADARWAVSMPRALSSGDLKLGNATIPCAVLSDGTRLLTQEGFLGALGRSTKPKGRSQRVTDGLPPFLATKSLKTLISQEILDTTVPVAFITPSGARALGFKAELLPKVCELFLEARAQKLLTTQQLPIAIQCEILMRGLAHVGIIALVDEATGHQDMRARDALAKILEAFVTKELRKWVSTFPAEYYRELFRLKGWQFPNLPQEQQKRPILVGKITNDIVYARLAPGVRSTLHKLTPRDEKGRLKNKLFQHLTEDTGHPKLREHLAKVVTVMQLSGDWPTFMGNMNRLMPKHKDLPPLLQLLDEKDS